MKELVRLVCSLALIGLVSGLLLAFTHQVTRDPIARAQREELLSSLRRVLPEYDNAPDQNVFTVQENGQTWTFYVARKGGALAGAAFVAASPNGYGGPIDIVIGVTPDQKLSGIEILRQTETPGLGSKVNSESFTKQFGGKDLRGPRWMVEKDGGDLHAITGATISSRAVAEAIRCGAEAYVKHAAAIGETGAD